MTPSTWPCGPALLVIGALWGCSAAPTATTAPADPKTDQSPALAPPTATAPLACAPGTMASIETGQCVAVGPATVAQAFSKQRDGWSVVAKRPAQACGPDERAAIGSDACVPIDDGCARAFPPSDAAIIVDPGQPAAGKVVATLVDALARAKPGDLIALESGQHPTFESSIPVRIVGRCASKAILTPMNGRVTGVWFTGAGQASLESVTITGAKTGVRAAVKGAEVSLLHVRLAGNQNGMDTTGGHITARQIVIDGPWTESNPISIGAAAQSGAIDIEDSALQNLGTHTGAAGAGSTLTLKRSILLGPTVQTASLSSVLVAATNGGVVTVEESALVTTQAVGNVDSGPADPGKASAAGALTIVRSEIAQSGATEAALPVSEGGKLTIEDSSFSFAAAFAITLVSGELTLTRSSLVGGTDGNDVREPLNLEAQSRATVEASALVGGRGSAISVTKSTLAMTRTLVTGTVCNGTPARGLEMIDDSTVTVQGSAFTTIEGSSILVGTSATATLTSTLIDAPRLCKGAEAASGVGVTVNASHALLDRVLIRGAAGPAMAYASGSVIVKASRFADSRVGILMASTDALLKVEDEPNDFIASKLVLYDTALDGDQDGVLRADGFY